MSNNSSWPAYTFDTAHAWIRECVPGAPERYVDLVATICKKRKGVWTRVTSQPKDRARRLIWDAFRIACHTAVWKDLAAWKEGTTGALIMATDQEKADFEYVMELTTIMAVKRQRGNK